MIVLRGIYTTEFWLALGYTMAGIVLTATSDNDWAIFLSIAIVDSSYIIGRVRLKSTMIKNVGGDSIEIGDISSSNALSVGKESLSNISND